MGRYYAHDIPQIEYQESEVNEMNLLQRIFMWIIALLISVSLFVTAVRADTDGTEIQITSQPEKLIIQLGPQWAGVQFSLKTDMGLFPVPVVVDQSGVLKMELGGSSTYTLSCFGSAVAAPQPVEPTLTSQEEPAQTSHPSTSQPAVNNLDLEHTHNANEVSLKFPVVFAIGLIVAVIGVIEIWMHKKKKAYNPDDDASS